MFSVQQVLTNVRQHNHALTQTLVMTVFVHRAKQCECQYATRLMIVLVTHVDPIRIVLIKQVATTVSV